MGYDAALKKNVIDTFPYRYRQVCAILSIEKRHHISCGIFPFVENVLYIYVCIYILFYITYMLISGGISICNHYCAEMNVGCC